MTAETIDEAVRVAVHETYREQWGRIVATVIRITGDWDLAEECAQDAFAQALERWPRDGLPRRPAAWITTTARNRAVDRLRRTAVEAARMQEVAALMEDRTIDGSSVDDSGIADDRLRLIFTCCHPALALEARVALTLRTLAGLTTAEIARAFLTNEATMAKRLVRAKRKIRHAGIPYRVPPAHLLPERVHGVLGVLYLMFTEGHTASAGPALVRHGLCDEAIRLARTLARLMPDEPEALGLLALMLLQHARRGARLDGTGELVTLEQQDRSRWDRATIAEGLAVLDSAMRRTRPGPYQIQAAIAACHACAPRAEDTDWIRIAELYQRLAVLVPSPVVQVNRAVAVAMAHGPAAGLRLVDELPADAATIYRLLPAVRADLLRRLGRHREAAASYREALALPASEPERRYLTRRLAELADATGP
ncbi:RNA polymerase sigma factor [Solwaraspora sp. WMMD791]|uniref:RNA polymerase sigma factor n=1 Tax=Solwaraspora sp. WMMD791 TaxID=3016086 RepID=UPI0032B4B7AF